MTKIIELNQREIISVAGGFCENVVTGFLVGALVGGVIVSYLTSDVHQKLNCIQECLNGNKTNQAK